MMKPKEIELTPTTLKFDGDPCSSITIVTRADGKLEVTMFNNPRYVKTKTRIAKWKTETYQTGTRITKVFSKVVFTDIVPKRIKVGNQEYLYAENCSHNYINYYDKPKVVTT